VGHEPLDLNIEDPKKIQNFLKMKINDAKTFKFSF